MTWGTCYVPRYWERTKRTGTCCCHRSCALSGRPPEADGRNRQLHVARERETRLPEHLMYGPAASGTISRESYAAELSRRMETAHDKLRSQQLQSRTGDKQEEPSFKTGQLVWLKPSGFQKAKATSCNLGIQGRTRSKRRPGTIPM